PVSASAWMKFTLSCTESGVASFCKPSRGPTSTNVTCSGNGIIQPPTQLTQCPRPPCRLLRKTRRPRCHLHGRGYCAPFSSLPPPRASRPQPRFGLGLPPHSQCCRSSGPLTRLVRYRL